MAGKIYPDFYKYDPAWKLNSIFSKCISNNGCLEWTGNFFKNKGKVTYPSIWYKKKVWKGNRLVLFLSGGLVPDVLFALHKCDNMKCINPTHLYWGTLKQNALDSRDRKTSAKAKKTFCPHGHPYSGENLGLTYRGYRYCKICKKRSNQALKAIETEGE